MTTSQSASLAVHGEVKRGSPHTEPKAPLTCGGEAPTARSEFFTPAICCLETFVHTGGYPVLPLAITRHLGLIVPSAILALESIVVINPAHPAIQSIRAVEQFDFRYDKRMFPLNR